MDDAVFNNLAKPKSGSCISAAFIVLLVLVSAEGIDVDLC